MSASGWEPARSSGAARGAVAIGDQAHCFFDACAMDGAFLIRDQLRIGVRVRIGLDAGTYLSPRPRTARGDHTHVTLPNIFLNFGYVSNFFWSHSFFRFKMDIV